MIAETACPVWQDLGFVDTSGPDDHGQVCETFSMAEVRAAVALRGPVAIDRQLAGWWSRVWADLLDGVIAGLPGFLLIEFSHQGSVDRLIGYLLVPIVGVVYGAILIGIYGRTLGMRALRVKAIHRATGRDLTRREAWKRALTAFALYQFVDSVLLLFEWTQPPGWPSHHHAVVSALDAIQFVLFLALLMPIWDSWNQTLQDKAVGSIVVVW